MLELVPKEGARYVSTAYWEGEPVRDIHLFIFGKLTAETTPDDLVDLEYAGAKRYALRKLAKRGLAVAQLKKLLKKYLVSEETVERLMAEFIEKSYLDDDAWIESFVRVQFARKYGPGAIRQKLLSKGISLAEIEKVLRNMDSSESRLGRIKSLLQARYRNRDLSCLKERQKVIGALLRKGFAFEDINESLTDCK